MKSTRYRFQNKCYKDAKERRRKIDEFCDNFNKETVRIKKNTETTEKN